MTAGLEELKQWIGRSESEIDYVTIPAVHRLAATLDRDDPVPKIGDPLPSGWHLILFPPVVRQSQVGIDGHPLRGGFMPPVSLPRRMYAGRRVVFHDELRVGDEVRRVSEIKDIAIKQGRSGQMVFITVKADLFSPRGLALSEEQDIVYRGEPDKNVPPIPPQAAPAEVMWKRKLTPDAVMVFRISALTFNGHRIHYDYPYTTGTEGYPGLIVPAHLHMLMVFELARAHAASSRMKSITLRNVRPLFVDRAIEVCGAPTADGKSAQLWVMDCDNALALTAQAEFS